MQGNAAGYALPRDAIPPLAGDWWRAVLALALLCVQSVSHAEQEFPRWSVTPLLGIHSPRLSLLSDQLYKNNLIGDAEILVYEGGVGSGAQGEDIDENITEIKPFEYDSRLPEIRGGALSGVEFQWQPNDRHGFIIGFGSWENTAESKTIGNLPLQQYFVTNRVASDRRARISFTEYTLGWRYNLKARDNFRFYGRLSLHELFDIDYREDMVFLFTDSPIADLIGVRRVMVVEAQTASLQLFQAGLGGEWFMRDWLSLGVEGGYLFGYDDFFLRHVVKKDDFLSGDSINRSGLPYAELNDGTLGYRQPDATVTDLANFRERVNYYRPMPLRFDGWRLELRVSIYY